LLRARAARVLRWRIMSGDRKPHGYPEGEQGLQVVLHLFPPESIINGRLPIWMACRSIVPQSRQTY
jgi:hypothetical protein